MSRCFPFPPPGYEREHRPEYLDSLKEEKHKDKKHKKEKKDKEHREGKEKKGKERSDEKHREKKDRKEKCKDKKEKHRVKKKNREKDKEKKSISDESAVAQKLEENSGEKLHSEGHDKIKSSSTYEGKHATQFLDQNGGKLIQNSLLLGSEESKFVQELDRRIRDDEKGAESQLLNRISDFSKRDQGATVRAGNEDSSAVLAGDKGKNKDKRVDSRKVDMQGFREDFSANMVQNNAGLAKSKVEAMPKPKEHKDDRLEGKERSKEKSDDSQGDKHKGKYRDKNVHGKDKARKTEKQKEKTREEKEEGIIENKKSEQDGFNYVGRNDLVGVTNNTSTHPLMDTNRSAVAEGNIRKIEDVSVNGILHESEVRPNKLQRLAPHQLTVNERNFEAYQNPNVSASYKQMSPSNNTHSDKEDKMMTVTLEAHELCPSKPKPSTATTTVKQNVETSKTVHLDSKFPKESLRVPKMENLIAEATRRPPHPDFKHLSEILAVPKVEELQTDDQEWLFYKNPPPIKPKVGLCGVREDLCVWSEAMYIESAEVYALPFVIPY